MSAARRVQRWLSATVALAALLAIAGILGSSTVRQASDVPPLPELAHDITSLYSSSDLHGRWDWTFVLHDQAPAAPALKLAYLNANGQIDGRLLAYSTLALELAGLALLFVMLRRALTVRALLLVSLATVAVVAMPTTRHLLASPTFQPAAVTLCLGLIQFWGFNRRCPTLVHIAIGFAAGGLAILSATAGVAASFASVVWLMTTALRRRRFMRHERVSLAVNLVLLAMGGAFILIRCAHAGSEAPVGSSLAALASWPFGHAWAIPLIWLPTLLGLAGWLRIRPTTPTAPALILLTLGAMAAIGLLSIGGATPDDSVALLTLGVLVNIAAWATVAVTTETGRTFRFVALTVWSTVMAVALLRPAATPPRDFDVTQMQIGTLARAYRKSAPSTSLSIPGTEAERHAANVLFSIPNLAPILPVSIRPGLRLEQENRNPAFRRDAMPPLAYGDSLGALGSWSNHGDHRVGDYISAPLHTSFPIVQLRIGGRLQAPETSIVLRPNHGPDIAPLQKSTTGLDRWRRVNLPAPGGEFRIVACATTSAQWLAFTEPIEVGPLTRLVAKIPPSWPLVASWLAAITGIGAAAVTIGRTTKRPGSLSRVRWAAVPWLALFGYAAFFSQHLDSTAGPNDSGGYLNSAKLLIAGKVMTTPRVITGLTDAPDLSAYAPITFHASGDQLVPEYPVGFPLELWLVGQLVGLTWGVPLLLLINLVAGVLVTQKLGRLFGLPTGWAWFASGIVGLSPVYLFEGLQPVSDVPALVAVGLAIYWAWISCERPGYAILAGVATALAVMIRPSNILAVGPLLICLAGHWRQLGYWVFAGVPGAAWLAWYQHRLYGSWLETGYGDISTSFACRFLGPTLHSYLTWLPELLGPALFLALGLPWMKNVAARVRWLLGVWALTFLGFYATYWCTWDNWYNMRFLLPALPALVIASLLVFHAAASRWQWQLFVAQAPWIARTATVVIVTATLGFLSWRTAERDVTFWMEANRKPAEAALWARRNLPADAVVFGKHLTGSLFYYTDLTFVRSDHPAAKDSPALYDQIAATGRPVFALTCHWETRGYDWRNGLGSGYPALPGTWDRVAVLEGGEVKVWRLRSPGSKAGER